jgi:AcrR family transcriptional regulator
MTRGSAGTAAAGLDRTRDADRSREAILEAAEALFARDGYDGASLGEIAASAGLSRGTPSYFFGSKERLYVAVVDRAFARRQAATRSAFAAVHAWCEGDGGRSELAAAFERAAEDYLAFLAESPSFVRLVVQEELNGGRGLRARTQASTAMEDAFGALRAVARERGLSGFSVAEAVMLFVGLTFMPMAHAHTFMRAIDRDLTHPAGRRAQARLVAEQLIHLVS